MRHLLSSPMVVATWVALLAAPAWAQGEALSGAEIEALLSGSVAEGTTSKGAGYQVRYDADGSAHFKLDNNSFADDGQWSVEGDAYCAEWDRIRKGKRGCWTVTDLGDGRYAFGGIDGADDLEVEIGK